MYLVMDGNGMFFWKKEILDEFYEKKIVNFFLL